MSGGVSDANAELSLRPARSVYSHRESPQLLNSKVWLAPDLEAE